MIQKLKNAKLPTEHPFAIAFRIYVTRLVLFLLTSVILIILFEAGQNWENIRPKIISFDLTMFVIVLLVSLVTYLVLDVFGSLMFSVRYREMPSNSTYDEDTSGGCLRPIIVLLVIVITAVAITLIR